MAKKYCYILIEGQYRLDVQAQTNLPLSINKQFASSNIDDSGSGGVYSFSFTVPASKANIRVLKRLFPQELQVPQTIPVTGQPSQASDSAGYPLRNAEIIINGLPVYKGQIALLNGKSFGTPESYDFTFYADNADWITQIQGKMLSELKFYDDNGVEQQLTFTFDDVVAANLNFPDSSIWCYPLISYGAMGSYAYNLQDGVDTTDADVNTANPGLITMNDLRPALSIRQLVIEIFRQFNYRVQSDFLDGNFFRRLIYPFHIGQWIIRSKKVLTNTYKANYTFHPLDDQHPDLPVQEVHGMTLGQSDYSWIPGGNAGNFAKDYDDKGMFIQDGGGSGYASMAYFQAPLNGLYNIKIDLVIGAASATPNKTVRRKVPYLALVKNLTVNSHGLMTGGTVLRQKTLEDGQPFSMYNDANGQPFNLVAGDKVYIYVYSGDWAKHGLFGFQSNTTGHALEIGDGSTINIEYADQMVTDGHTVTEPLSVSDLLPEDQEQIDFLRGLFHLFNLIAETDTQGKTVRIEPRNDVTCWNDFNGGKRTYKGFYDYNLSPEDWARKVDISQENTAAVTTDLAKKVYLSYATDQKYYTSVYDFGRDFATSDKDVKNNPFFSEVLHIRDGNISAYYKAKSIFLIPPDVQPLYMPKMWDGDKDSDGNFPTETFQHDPAILFFHGTTNMPQLYGVVIRDADGTDHSYLYSFGLAYVVCYDDTTGYTPSLSFCTETLGKSFNPNDSTKWPKVKGLAELFYLEYFSQLRDGIRLTIPIYLRDTDFVRLNSRRLKQLFGRSYILEQFSDYNPTLEGPTKFQLLLAKPAEYLDYVNLQIGNDNTDDVNTSDDGVTDENPTPVTSPDVIKIKSLYFLSYLNDASGTTQITVDGYDGAQVLYVDRDGTPLTEGADYIWDTDASSFTFTAPLNVNERMTAAMVCNVEVSAGSYDGFFIKFYTNTSGSDQTVISLGSTGYDLLYIDRNGTDLYPVDSPEGYSNYDSTTGELTLVAPLRPGESLQFVGIQQFASANLRSQYFGATYTCLALDGEASFTVPQLAGCTILLLKRGIHSLGPTDYTYNVNTGTFMLTKVLKYKETLAVIGAKTITI